MVIDASIVVSATAGAEAYRLKYSSCTPKSSSGRESYSPIAHTTPPNSNNNKGSLGKRLRLKRTFGGESPYTFRSTTDDDTGASECGGDGYFCSPITPISASSFSQNQSWQVNSTHSHSHLQDSGMSTSQQSKGPNPLLSAIPRSSGLIDINMGIMNEWENGGAAGRGNGKRRVEEVDIDDEGYDGAESVTSVVGAEEKISDKEVKLSRGRCVVLGKDTGIIAENGGAEKKAAWLLMKLSVKDGEDDFGGLSIGLKANIDGQGPRIKRRRATSM
jgi:hypothetical protein